MAFTIRDNFLVDGFRSSVEKAATRRRRRARLTRQAARCEVIALARRDFESRAENGACGANQRAVFSRGTGGG